MSWRLAGRARTFAVRQHRHSRQVSGLDPEFALYKYLLDPRTFD